jgi:hypothetical protein
MEVNVVVIILLSVGETEYGFNTEWFWTFIIYNLFDQHRGVKHLQKRLNLNIIDWSDE